MLPAARQAVGVLERNTSNRYGLDCMLPRRLTAAGWCWRQCWRMFFAQLNLAIFVIGVIYLRPRTAAPWRALSSDTKEGRPTKGAPDSGPERLFHLCLAGGYARIRTRRTVSRETFCPSAESAMAIFATPFPA
jgi:hypothetical protein